LHIEFEKERLYYIISQLQGKPITISKPSVSNVIAVEFGMDSPTCPICHSSHRQIKNGHTLSGSQQYRCQACQKTYNPHPKQQGYPPALKQQALQMYVDGLSFRRIARLLGVNHQSVVNWVNAAHKALPAAKPPSSGETVAVIEMDELFTFVGSKKPMSTS
jgi:transposase-like protein